MSNQQQPSVSHGLNSFRETMKTPVFIVSMILGLAFVIAGITLEDFGHYMTSTFNWIVTHLGWTFILGASFFLFVTIFLTFSPLGAIKLGEDDEKPEYSTLTWFAMLFSAGMGIGLLFWGVSEPLSHYSWPPFGEAQTNSTIHLALQYSFFHWGLHPWAIYAVVACAIAYFTYRKGLPMLLSSTLEPLLGRDNLNGKVGNTVNIIGILATLFGISTSLGLGVMQIGSGIETLFGIPNKVSTQLIIVVIITILAIWSSNTGINKGIKWLSQINIGVAGLLMIIVFIFGPTLFILNTFTHSTGTYLQNLLYMSFGIDAAGEGTEGWYGAWTIFYWAFWIAWAPFVGSFIARVSRGRTIRSFMVGVLLVPTGVSMVWFSVFGGAALYKQHFAGVDMLGALSQSEAQSFYTLLGEFPLSGFLIVIAMISLIIFFVTSADSGTYVIGMLSSKGNPNPPVGIRATWGIVQGLFALVLLIAVGTAGLKALQTASVIGGLPFMFIMFLMIYCLFKALSRELKDGSLPIERQRIYSALEDLRAERKIHKDVFVDSHSQGK